MGPNKRLFRIVIWLIVASLLLSSVAFAIGLLVG